MPATAPQAPPQVYHGIPLHCNWSPDAHALNAQVTHEAKGVLPAPYGFTYWPGLVTQSAALSTAAYGGFTVLKSDGSRVVYTGTAATLQRYTTISTWTDVSRLAGGAYSLTSDEFWSMDQFGSTLIAVQMSDAPQSIDVEAGSNFAALGGSPPTARYVKVFGDFVMLFGLVDNPNRLQWSGRNNSAFWTAGERDSDYQDFPDGGWVRGVASFGNGRGLVFQDTAIRLIAATNDRTVFNFQLLEENQGLVAPHSLVTHGTIAYYLDRHGFLATDGTGTSRHIGVDRVDKWFKDNCETTRLTAVVGSLDPERARIFWLFPSSGNVDELFDMVLCYDIVQDAWSYTDDITASFIFPAASLGFNGDDIDTFLTANGWTLETAPFSFDAAFLLGGTPVLAYFDDDFKLAFQNGSALAAEMETADWQLVPGQRALVRGCRPLADTTSATVAIGSKERAQGAVTFGSESSMNAQGFCPLRSSGRYHALRVSIAAGTEWSHFHGFELDDYVTPAGLR